MRKPWLFKNLPPFLILAGALLIVRPGSAQDLYVGSNSSGQTTNFTSGTNSYANTYVGYNAGASNNTLTVAITNTLLTNSADLNIGYNGSGNSMIVSNAAQVANAGNGFIGNIAPSSNNFVLVTGLGSTWSNSGYLLIGSDGSGNSMVISNGAQVVNNYGSIGKSATSSNNSVLVTGLGSTWSNSGGLEIGYDGSGNSMVISNGAQVVNHDDVYISDTYSAPSSNNSVLVTGSGSTWSSSAGLYIGSGGSGNSMVISNGAQVVNYSGSVSGTSNTAIVTGSGSSWSISSLLGVGGIGSSLVISNSAAMTVGGIYLGESGSGNLLLVTGAGSSLTNSGMFYVGMEGTNNSVVLSNGATMTAGGIYVGYSYWNVGSGNSLLVTGTGSSLTNSGILAVGYDGIVGIKGNNNSVVLSNGATMTAGRIYVGGYSSGNSLLVTGTGSSLTNSGSLAVGTGGSVGSEANNNSVVVSNGATLNSYSAAISTGSSNSFSNSVIVTGTGSIWNNSNALTLGDTGSGTLTVGNGGKVISGSVVIASAPGSIGTLNIGSLGGSDTAGTIAAPTISFGGGQGTLNFNQRDTTTFISSITGAGTVQQLGSGTTILSGSNSYTGTTKVNAGVLLVDNTTGWGVGSGLTVNSNGIVGGSGSIAGAALINGLLDPSRGSTNAMTLSFNTNVTLGATATTMVDLLNTGSYDKIEVGGTLAYGGIFDIALGNTNAPGTYQFFSTLAGGTNIITTGSFSTVELTGLFGTWLMTNSSGIWNYANGSDSYNFSQAAGQLIVTAVPEPSTYALLGLSVLAVFVVLRRNRMSE